MKRKKQRRNNVGCRSSCSGFYQDTTEGFPLCKNVFTQLLIAFVKKFGE